MTFVNSWIFLTLSVLSIYLVLSIVSDSEYSYGQKVEPTKIVHAGEGNASSVVLAFIPSNVEIKVGESVQWINPNQVAEPHSVTFLKEKKYFADFAAPFQVANSIQFQPLDPKSNTEPAILPGKPEDMNKTVVMVNSRAVMPVVIDSTGQNVSYLEPNSNYTMNGTESYVNAGWLWPEGQAPPGGPSISKFTVTFEKAGTYPYMCNVHPWMTGSVVVK